MLTPLPAQAAGPLCYVDADASGAATGDSWADAYPTAQDALTDPGCTEIWVAEGVYYPDEGAGQTEDIITSTFVLTNGVALYGGFDGTETNRSQRDPAANITVLSGDIDQNDIADPNGVVTNTANITGTNAWHVVTGSGTDSTAVLDGFNITAGRANSLSWPDNVGGGMYNEHGSPALTNVTFSGNSADYGGGMENDNSSPVLTNVTFSGNSAVSGGGMDNGYSSPVLTNVTFSGNSASNGGGGMYNWQSSPALTNVTFFANSANSGGGMYNYNSNPALTNVTFSGNSASFYGGGMYNLQSSPALTNTIIANSASGGDCVNDSNGSIAPGSINNLIEDSARACGLINGTDGNIIGFDPHLGALTDYSGPGKQVFPLLMGSPAIDAGSNTNCPAADQRGVTRPVGTACDIGAFELRLTLSKQVDNSTPLPGQPVTFTLIVANAGLTVTNGLLLDALPAGLNFLGPITLAPAGAGTVGDAPPVLASNLTISSSQRITVTFPVTVSYGLAPGTSLTNTAAVSATEVPTPTWASAVVTVANICYVDANASGAATGGSWADAYPTVQDALVDATCTEVWVAEGVYYPDEGVGQTEDVITSTFALTNGVALYGGFAGTETQRDQRNPAANITVLSGDIDQNDTTDPSGVVTDTVNIIGANAYHVVTGSGTDDTAVLDGFTITAGQANGYWPDTAGGGMYNYHSSPALTDVTFSGNHATNNGGGMYNYASSPTLTDVIFSANSAAYGGGMYNYASSPTLTGVIFSDSPATYGGGMYNNYSSLALTDVIFSANSATYGGGMYNEYLSNPTLTEVTFSGNSADYGGGMHNSHSRPTLTDVTFAANSASDGGGIFNNSSSPTLTNVTFSASSATHYGGGMYNDYSSPTLTNVTFSDSSATHGGGMYNNYSSPTLTDVIFSTNSADHWGGGMHNDSSSPTLTDVTFSANSASYGGGMYNYNSSNPTLTEIIFSTNSAISGGGMFNNQSSPALTEITFFDNSVTYRGGGMYNDSSNPTLMGITFSANSAISGGGMFNYQSSPALTNVTFSANSADHWGGGMHNDSSSPTLTNVTFSTNSASDGGGMYNDGSSPTLTNTIIANSISGGDCANWAGGSIAPGSTNNLIEDSDNACGLSNGVNGNIIGPDPHLDTLTDYGGPGKQVFPLLLGSLAIDTGTNTNCPATDQRGDTRPMDGDGNSTAICDIGAFELSDHLIISKQVDDPIPLPGQTVTFTLIVTNTDLLVTNGLLSDTLPAGLNFLGPITLEPVRAGTVGTAPPTLASGLTISSGQRITVTFPVTVSWNLAAGTSLTNTATVSATQVPTPTQASAVVTVAGTCYVDASASGAATGLNWANAYPTVQDALANAACAEIWVAKGVYYPDEGTGQADDDRASTFALTDGVALYGGFAGTETQRDQRNPAANITVLSGDIDQNDTTDPSGVVTDTANINGANAYHVVTGSGTDSTAVLDGFTITAGQANAGGGMYNHTGSPTLTFITFSGNSATFGGGMYNANSSSPRMTDVTFSGNFAPFGGGVYNEHSSPVLTNGTFSANSAAYGGGMYDDDYSSPTLTDVTFSANLGLYEGGGVYNSYSSLVLVNTIIANSIGGDCINANGGYIASGSTNNLIEDSDNACGLMNGTDGNIIGQDPNLGALTDYGGPGKQVFPLLLGSPAIDAGANANCPATDQRGAPRPADGDGDNTAICDIGAFELGYYLSLSKQVDDPAPLPGQTVTFTLIVDNTDLTVTNGLLSDTLPAGLNFLGPITLEPAGAGDVGTAPPTLGSNLTISNSQHITVTFPVTVSYSLAPGTSLTNTASVSATEVPTPTQASTIVTVNEYHIYLPLALKY